MDLADPLDLVIYQGSLAQLVNMLVTVDGMIEPNALDPVARLALLGCGRASLIRQAG